MTNLSFGVFLLALISAGRGDNSCIFTDEVGGVWDFTSLKNTQNIQWDGKPIEEGNESKEVQTWFFSLCTGLSWYPYGGECTKTNMVCKSWTEGDGNLKSQVIIADPSVFPAVKQIENGISLYYVGDTEEPVSGQSGLDSYVDLVCGDGKIAFSQDIPNPVYQQRSIWYITISTPTACRGSKSRPSKMGGGWITIIVFFVTLTTYFIVGMAYNKFLRNQKGVDIVPNHSFWASIPSLVKDGGVFLYNKATGREVFYTSV